MVANSYLGHTGTDSLDDARALVAQDEGVLDDARTNTAAPIERDVGAAAGEGQDERKGGEG